MKRVAKRFRIKQFRTTAFHPESNGLKERQHSSLNEYLKIFTNKFEDWDEFCEMSMLNYNSARHEATHYTPYELMFARIARVPSAAPPEPEDLLPTYDGYMKKLIERLNALHEIAREKIMLAKIKAKKYFDRKVNPKEIKVNDYVWLLSGPKPGKLDNQYSGPYLVLEVWENGNVRIEIRKNHSKIVHSNRLRLSYIKP